MSATLPAKAPETILRRVWDALPRITPGWAHILRTLLAFTIALYTAYSLELDSPSSSGLTVLIVSAASRGAVISKSIYRLLGSVVGGIISIVLIAFTAQAPWLFIIGFSFWLAICTFLASLLRYFRSYGAVLAGYTIAIVGVPAITNPENVLMLAFNRVAVVGIGVLSCALVFLITDRGRGRGAIIAGVVKLLVGTARFVRDVLAGAGKGETMAAGTKVIAEVEAMDQVVEFASVEDTGIGRHVDDLRLAGAALFALLVSSRRLVALLEDPAIVSRSDVAEARVMLADIVGRIASLDNAPETAARLSADTQQARARVRAMAEACEDSGAMAALLRAEAMLYQFGTTLEMLVALHDDKPRAVRLKMKAYVNPVTALRNGVRAGLALFLGGAFWLISGWSDGANMLVLLGPVCALLGTLDSAAQASVAFFKGLVVAVIVGTLINYTIMPMITGFPLLIVVMGTMVAVALRVTQIPRYALAGLGFQIFSVVMISPTNPMVFDLTTGLNNAFAFLVGGSCAVLTFFVLLPANPPAEARVLQRSLRRAVRALARGGRPAWLSWEHLQYQKLVRLSRRLASIEPSRSAAALTEGGDVVLVGRAIIRVRKLAEDGRLSRPDRLLVEEAVEAFGRVLEDPCGVATRVHAIAERIAASEQNDHFPLEAATLLHEAATLTENNAAFFARGQFWAAAEPAR